MHAHVHAHELHPLTQPCTSIHRSLNTPTRAFAHRYLPVMTDEVYWWRFHQGGMFIAYLILNLCVWPHVLSTCPCPPRMDIHMCLGHLQLTPWEAEFMSQQARAYWQHQHSTKVNSTCICISIYLYHMIQQTLLHQSPSHKKPKQIGGPQCPAAAAAVSPASATAQLQEQPEQQRGGVGVDAGNNIYICVFDVYIVQTFTRLHTHTHIYITLTRNDTVRLIQYRGRDRRRRPQR